jgi:bacteriocin-like protein
MNAESKSVGRDRLIKTMSDGKTELDENELSLVSGGVAAGWNLGRARLNPGPRFGVVDDSV